GRLEGHDRRYAPTYEQTKQLQRNLTEKILDRAASDPEWRQRLLEDSEAALQEANFPELQQIGQGTQRDRQEETEVAGQVGGQAGGQYCRYTWNDLICPYRCIWYTYQWYATYYY
ncbi:MAG TPA: hypothetical protein VHJ78_05915, partial [Actinomycetota bacterium]|nr:hypothetical protein [Actinomycetota bacterium]